MSLLTPESLSPLGKISFSIDRILDKGAVKENTQAINLEVNTGIRKLTMCLQKFPLFPLEYPTLLPNHFKKSSNNEDFLRLFPLPPSIIDGPILDQKLVFLIDYCLKEIVPLKEPLVEDVLLILSSIISHHLFASKNHWLEFPRILKHLLLLFLKLNTGTELDEHEKRSLCVIYLSLKSLQFRIWMKLGNSFQKLLDGQKFLNLIAASTLTTSEIPFEISPVYIDEAFVE